MREMIGVINDVADHDDRLIFTSGVTDLRCEGNGYVNPASRTPDGYRVPDGYLLEMPNANQARSNFATRLGIWS